MCQQTSQVNFQRYNTIRSQTNAQNNQAQQQLFGARAGATTTTQLVGATLTSLLALFAGRSETPFLLTLPAYRPLTYSVLLVWTILQAIQIAKRITDRVDRIVATTKAAASTTNLTRIRSSVSASSARLVELARGCTASTRQVESGATKAKSIRSLAISIKEPFLATEVVAELSLSDLKDLMRFAEDVNRLDFHKSSFLSTLREPCKKAALAMDRVLSVSRGKGCVISARPVHSHAPSSSTQGATAADDMDALAFVAFVRIFAEWRSVRLVPNGYHGYAAGMGIAKRDLLQNVQKIEKAVHKLMSSQEGGAEGAAAAEGRQLASPTIKQLLLWERDQGIHVRLPCLVDKSGASGLLWTFRQIQYQTTIFENLTRIPVSFSSTKQAVLAAYKLTYDDYHGFWVKQIFQKSFDAAPEAQIILDHMNPVKLPSSKEEDIMTESTLLMDDTSRSGVGSDSGDAIEIEAKLEEEKMTKPLNPFEQFGNNIQKEWMKFERLLKQCRGCNVNAGATHKDALDVSLPKTLTKSALASKQSAEEEIPSFLAVVQPILADFDMLITELNMKDPSKC